MNNHPSIGFVSAEAFMAAQAVRNELIQALEGVRATAVIDGDTVRVPAYVIGEALAALARAKGNQ